ncbi:FAD-dependent monooxygenase [Sesbania bispinosa]|nr:FAD-dependent monooxygenase [Sesbania bispinosa]
MAKGPSYAELELEELITKDAWFQRTMKSLKNTEAMLHRLQMSDAIEIENGILEVEFDKEEEPTSRENGIRVKMEDLESWLHLLKVEIFPCFTGLPLRGEDAREVPTENGTCATEVPTAHQWPLV